MSKKTIIHICNDGGWVACNGVYADSDAPRIRLSTIHVEGVRHIVERLNKENSRFCLNCVKQVRSHFRSDALEELKGNLLPSKNESEDVLVNEPSYQALIEEHGRALAAQRETFKRELTALADRWMQENKNTHQNMLPVEIEGGVPDYDWRERSIARAECASDVRQLVQAFGKYDARVAAGDLDAEDFTERELDNMHTTTAQELGGYLLEESKDGDMPVHFHTGMNPEPLVVLSVYENDGIMCVDIGELGDD